MLTILSSFFYKKKEFSLSPKKKRENIKDECFLIRIRKKKRKIDIYVCHDCVIIFIIPALIPIYLKLLQKASAFSLQQIRYALSKACRYRHQFF